MGAHNKIISGEVATKYLYPSLIRLVKCLTKHWLHPASGWRTIYYPMNYSSKYQLTRSDSSIRGLDGAMESNYNDKWHFYKSWLYVLLAVFYLVLRWTWSLRRAVRCGLIQCALRQSLWLISNQASLSWGWCCPCQYWDILGGQVGRGWSGGGWQSDQMVETDTSLL